jgi:threonine/homoserine/homoserine lactone efflux protein
VIRGGHRAGPQLRDHHPRCAAAQPCRRIAGVLGIACGAVVCGLVGFFGIHALFTLTPFLYLAMKMIGSAYLVLLGIRYLRNSFRDDGAGNPAGRNASIASMRLDFLTRVANPQNALSTASLFVATRPPQPPLSLGLGTISVMAGIAITWYTLAGCGLTLRPAAAVLGRIRRRIDRVAGVAFIGLGTNLALPH